MDHKNNEASGKPNHRIVESFREAQNTAGTYVIMEGDWGGQIYLSCPMNLVKCDENTLENLLIDLDAIAWKCNEGEGRARYYEIREAGEEIGGGMGGGEVTEELWVHQEFHDLNLYEEIEQILAGTKEKISKDAGMKQEDIKRLLMEKRLVNTPLIGCTQEEVIQLEDRIGFKLPEIYKQFLLAVGHESGRLFQGTAVHYKNLMDIQEWAKELLEEHHNPIALSPTSFVFSMHQGYEIRFFDITMGENPPVFLWYEGMENPGSAIALSDTFEEFLLQEIEEHSRVNWREE